MIDDKINMSLKKLESELKGVEAARKQVNDTVNSFNGLRISTSEYVKSLDNISKTLNQLINDIKNKYESNIEEFEKDRKEIVDSTKKLVNFDKATEDIRDTLQKKFNVIQLRQFILFAINIFVVILLLLIIIFK